MKRLAVGVAGSTLIVWFWWATETTDRTEFFGWALIALGSLWQIRMTWRALRREENPWVPFKAEAKWRSRRVR